MNERQLLKRLAYLEFAVDQLNAEVLYVDQLMRSVGFIGGLETVKLSALELIDEGEESGEKAS